MGLFVAIDTEGSINPDRVYKAAVSLTRNRSCTSLFRIIIHETHELLGESPRSIMRGIHLVRVATQVQMIAFLNTMDEWLDKHPEVREYILHADTTTDIASMQVNLVVIDTLSFHFRQPTLDMKSRARIMEL